MATQLQPKKTRKGDPLLNRHCISVEMEALNSTQTAGKDTSEIQWLPVLLVMSAVTSDCRMINCLSDTRNWAGSLRPGSGLLLNFITVCCKNTDNLDEIWCICMVMVAAFLTCG